MNRKEYEYALFERAFDYEEACTSLAQLIEAEHLEELAIERETILYAMEACHAIVPCHDYLILTYDHIDFDTRKRVAEYAIYSQHDRDGMNLPNAINYNAIYRLEFIGEELFDNMAAAIAYAYNLVHTIHTNDENMRKENDHEK